MAGIPKLTGQRVAIICLILAVFDALAGQRVLAMVFAGVAIVISLVSGFRSRGERKNGKGR